MAHAPAIPRPDQTLNAPRERLPPTNQCLDGVCIEVPGFKEAKFRAINPLYVKVYHPSPQYQPWWHGEYTFLYKRALCSSVEEACSVLPYEGTKLAGVDSKGNPNPAGSIEVIASAVQTFPANAAEPRWYTLHVDTPDGSTPQSIRIFVTEDNAVGAPSGLAKVEVIDFDGSTAVLTSSGQPLDDVAPTLVDDRWVWEIKESSGLLDLTNSGVRDQKYYVKISRPSTGTTPEVRFWISWETNLTWLYGPQLGGDPGRVICRDNTDDFSDDEVYMQVKADTVRYPSGARSGEAEDGPDLDTSFDENADEEEWTERIIPRLGNNSHGVPYAEQKAIKFTTQAELQLNEEDSGLTFGDDSSNITIKPLGRVSGSRAVPDANWPGAGDYRHRGASLSHSRPQKPCTNPSDCAEPLACRGGFCLQAAVP